MNDLNLPLQQYNYKYRKILKSINFNRQYISTENQVNCKEGNLDHPCRIDTPSKLRISFFFLW